MSKSKIQDWSPKRPLIEKLGQVAPSIAFSVRWEEDPNFRWDGDGLDPAEEGFIAYDVDVAARAIVNGKLEEGEAHLGGSYSKPGEHDPDIHGYLNDLLQEALDRLKDEVGALPDIKRARDYLKEDSRKSYEAQRRRIESEGR